MHPIPTPSEVLAHGAKLRATHDQLLNTIEEAERMGLKSAKRLRGLLTLVQAEMRDAQDLATVLTSHTVWAAETPTARAA